MKRFESLRALDQWTIERLSAWRAGDREAGDEVVRQYIQLARYFLVCHVGRSVVRRHSELCYDVVHDALIYTMARHDPSRGSFSRLLAIAVMGAARVIARASRRAARQERMPDGYDPPWPPRDSVCDIRLIHEMIRRSVRTPFEKWYAEHIIAGGDWQPAAVARIVGEPRKRIAKRIERFRARVVDALRSRNLGIYDFLDD